MRDIKFRAWDNEENRFIDLNGFSIGFNSMPYPGIVYGVTEQGVLREKCSDELTIEQYTGLKDKNGQEIFEGDIIEHSDAAWRAEVKWCESGKWILNYTAMGREVLLSDRTDYIIVIGNIHSNPELL
jgi:uncharacterized phage protein (TIGR01671 family)